MLLLRLLRGRAPRRRSQETTIYDQLSPLFSQSSSPTPTSSVFPSLSHVLHSSIICSARCWRWRGRGLGAGHLVVTVMDGESRTGTAIGDPPFSSGVLPVVGDAWLLMVISCAAPRSAFADRWRTWQHNAACSGPALLPANTLQSI